MIILKRMAKYFRSSRTKEKKFLQVIDEKIATAKSLNTQAAYMAIKNQFIQIFELEEDELYESN